MPSYSFEIRKADHLNLDGTADLHVHIYFNQGRRRRLLGRYRLPTLQPVFPSEPQLNQNEERAVREWLGMPEQLRKLQAFARETLFDLPRLVREVPGFAEVVTEEGELYIKVRIPVVRRVGTHE